MSISIAENIDCMLAMREFPDKYFDICISDACYGIGAGHSNFINGTSASIKTYYKENDFDSERTEKKYFDEMIRVSKNQIFWGGNYFIDYLTPTRCFVIWDKTIHGNSYSDCEMAWTSFDKPARIYSKNMVEVNLSGRIHPTQKPISLYKFLLKNYAESGNKIIDCFLGSGSSRIACYDMGFDFYGYELDTDYFNAQEKRFKDHISQERLFVPQKEIIKDIELF